MSQATRQDAECIIVFSLTLATLEDAMEPDYETATGLYALIGYFTGKIVGRDGAQRLDSLLNQDLTVAVEAAYDAIEPRCVAEADRMAGEVAAMYKLPQGD